MQPYKSYTNNDKQFLLRRIKNIKIKKCYIDIFKLLINKNIKYMKNNNGIFFNLGLLSDEDLHMIHLILKFYEKI